MPTFRYSFYSLLILGIFSAPCMSPAQTATENCTLAQPSLATVGNNIFSEEQETELGDALAEHFEAELRLAPTSDNDALNRIGQRLLATLPPTKIPFRFRVYDSAELNAYSLAGGRVYVSRKLITALTSEDDLAGVLAHEIGHLITHQTATDLSQVFAVRLGVKSVTTREDIAARVHQMMSTPEKAHETKQREIDEELAADRVALYAMTQAGYQPRNFSNFFDRITVNQGKKGSWFSDFFGLTRESTIRYRATQKLMAEMPVGCQQRVPHSSAEFQAWQKQMSEERIQSTSSESLAEAVVKLAPVIHPSPWNLRFSPDGRYLISQDEGGVNVADRSTSMMLYRIEAPEADTVRFADENKELVLLYPSLRAERWSMATGKRIGVTEIVVPEGCAQHELGTDGRTMLCLTLKANDGGVDLSLKLIDIVSGQAYFQNPKFRSLSVNTEPWAVQSAYRDLLGGYQLMNTAWSPDGHYVIGRLAGESFSYDLSKREPLKLPGIFKGHYQPRFSFISNNELSIIGDYDTDGYAPFTTYSLPDGRKLDEMKIGNQQLETATEPETLKVSPLKDYYKGIINAKTHQLLATTHYASIDLWKQNVLSELPTGGMMVQDQATGKRERIEPLDEPLPDLHAAIISADGAYLALSLKNRAALWDLTSGKQITILRPFESGWFNEQNQLIAILPKFVDKPAIELAFTVDPLSNLGVTAKDLGTFNADDAWQSHMVELQLKPAEKSKDYGHNVTLEARSLVGHTALWSTHFAHERPAIWNSEDSRIVFAWDLAGTAAKEILKLNPALEAEAQKLKDQKKGLLLETVDGESGKVYQKMVLPEADLSHGWRDDRWARASGEFLLVHGEHENTVIYRLGDGSKVGEFFGTVISTNAAFDVAVALNRENELLLVNESTGKEVRRLHFSSPVRLARVLVAANPQLVVITADQKLHRVALPEFAAHSSATN